MAGANHFRARKLSRLKNLPVDSVPIQGFNGTDITSVTAQQIIAGVAGKTIFISKLIINNKTVAEDPIITVQDDEGSPVEICSVMPSTVGGNGGNAVFDFDPPVAITKGADLDGVASGSLGDTVIHASGWIGTV